MAYIVFLLAVVLLPFNFAGAQVNDPGNEQRCWLESNCKDGGGIWARSLEYTREHGEDAWSVENCRDVVPGKPAARCFVGSPSIPLQIGIPGVSERFCSVYELGKEPRTCSTNADCSPDKGKCQPGIKGGFPGYLAAFYKFFVAALAVIAVVMVMWGGFKRIMAAGSAERIKDANDTIFSAISGLILALVSYSLLQLINPQLVKNTLPLIEKVKPDFFGFCPAYDKNPVIYDSGYKTYHCVGGTNVGISCTEDAQCAQGKCQLDSDKQSGRPSETCGQKLVLDGRECMGLECGSIGQGCFKDSDGKKSRCSNVMFKGNLSGMEVNKMALQIICDNTNPATGHDCAIETPGGEGTSSSISVEGNSYYAIRDCLGSDQGGQRSRIYPGQWCSTGSPKGYALLVEVEAPGICTGVYGKGCDDWYAIDASSCGGVTKRITGNNIFKDDPVSSLVTTLPYDMRLEWAEVPASKLFNPVDAGGNLINTVTCDLNIISQEFRDR